MGKAVRIGSGFAALALLLGGSLALRCSAARPSGLGLAAGRLAPCPDRPHCVSSQAAPGSARHVAPLLWHGSDAAASDAAWQRARAAALALDGAALVVESAGYLHVEVTSPLMRFVDDLELALDRERRCIDVRSASRVGYSDLGANRARVEALRAAFARSE